MLRSDVPAIPDTLAMHIKARRILGDDFLWGREVGWARNIAYQDAHLLELEKKLPEDLVLEQYREKQMILVAGPPSSVAFYEAASRFLFGSRTVGDKEYWYQNPEQTFVFMDKADALCWMVFPREPLQNSFMKSYADQFSLVKHPMSVPNAAEVLWFLTTYKMVCNDYLFSESGVRTSSVDSKGNPVIICNFDDDGIGIHNIDRNESLGDVGISPFLKF